MTFCKYFFLIYLLIKYNKVINLKIISNNYNIDMSDNESDESLNTEDLMELTEAKKDYTGGVERSSAPNPKKEKVKKKPSKPVLEDVETENVIEEKPKVKKEKKPRTQAQIEATKRMIEANKKKKEDKLKNLENSKVESKKIEKVKPIKEEPLEEVEEKPKKKMGRPKTKEIIRTEKIKEKIIYMIPNSSGGYEEVKNPKPLTKKDLKKIELEKQAKQDEIEIGKKLVRKKSGAVDNRSKNTRSEKQIENSKKLVEFNKKKREERLKLQKQQLNETIKEQVEDSMINVVTKPISQVKEERKERKARNIITPEERKAYEFNKTKSLFC